jgi:hypothetical protein
MLALLTAAVMTTAPPATGSFLREYAETRHFGA